MDGSGVVVYLKRLESSKLLFFLRNFNDFVARGSNLVGWTSSSMGRDSIYVGRNSSSGGSENQYQVLPNAPRHSQELPEAARSWKKRFLAGFRPR